MPKPHRIATRADLDDALAALMEADRRLAAIARQAGEIPFVARRKHGFEALMSIIVSQQLSVAAADTIFARLRKAVVPFTPERMLEAGAETLRACGLSAPKQKHMKTIAAAILDGSLDLKRIRAMRDDDAREHLVAVKGIGPWTADIYLMASLGRADVWPVGDVGLQAAVARGLKLRKRPNEKQMEKLSQNWRPWRTVAARMFWMHEGSLRREKKQAEAEAKALKASMKQGKL
jgi:DNA-3-methyladenine glycosylase II